MKIYFHGDFSKRWGMWGVVGGHGPPTTPHAPIYWDDTLIMIFAWFIGMGCYMLSFFSIFLTIPFAGSSGEVDPMVAPFFLTGFFIPFIIFGAIFIGGAIFIVYGIVGAIMTFQGKNFHYIVIGKQLARYLEKD